MMSRVLIGEGKSRVKRGFHHVVKGISSSGDGQIFSVSMATQKEKGIGADKASRERGRAFWAERTLKREGETSF